MVYRKLVFTVSLITRHVFVFNPHHFESEDNFGSICETFFSSFSASTNLSLLLDVDSDFLTLYECE